MFKYLRKLLFIVAMFVVPWVTQGQSFDYSCDFEDENDTAGWVFVNGSQTNKWFIGTATNNGGTHSLYVSNNNGTSNAYTNTVITFVYAYQEFTLDAGGYAISYDWMANGESNYDYIRVFLAPASSTLTAGQSPDGTSAYVWSSAALPAGFISLSGANKLNLQTSWSNYTAEFAIPTAGTYRLVFAWANDGSGGNNPPGAIDNIQFQQPVCPRPANLQFSNITTHSFDVSWTETGSATSWLVQVDSVGTNIVSDIAYDTTYSVIGRSSNTDYSIRVSALCGTEDTSWYISSTFRTPCTFLDSLPFVETFEGASTGTSATSSAFVNCWGHLNNGTTYGGYPHVGGSTYNHTPGGSKGLYWYNTTTMNTYGDYQCIVLPGVDTDIYPINTLQLSFWARSSSTSYSPVFYVGVMTNPNDINTFVPVDTVNVGSNTTFAEFTTMFSRYTGYGNYIAVKAVRPTSSWYAYVDDFTLDLMPACPWVDNMMAENIGTDEATVRWTEQGSGTSWTVVYGPSGFSVDDPAAVTLTASDPYITLTSLTPNTAYDVYVTVDCDTEISESQMISFRTVCAFLDSLPFVETFESASTGTSSTGSTFVNCWGHLNNGTSYGGYPYVGGSTYNHTPGGAKGLYWYNSITAGTYGDYQCVVLPGVDTDIYPINTLQLKFWARASSASYSPVFYVGVMTDQHDINTFVPVDTVNVGNITTFEEFTTLFSRYTGYGNYIAVKAVRPTSSWYAYVDDFTLEVMPACPAVTDMAVEDIGAEEATVRWTEQADGTSWTVIYGPSGFNMDDPEAVTLSATDNSITLTSLTPNTAYDVYVIVDCSSEPGGVNMISFRTACSNLSVLPFVETFEDAPTGSSSTGSPFANCWVRLNNGTSYGGYPYVSSTASYNHTTGGSKGLYWYNTTTTGTYGDYQCIVLPGVDTDIFPINTLQLRFWTRATSTSYSPVFQVGVMTDPFDINTFVPVDTVNVGSNTTFAEFVIPFVDYIGYGSYIAVKAVRPTSSWYANIDDVMLEVIPDCPRVEDMVVENIGTEEATVRWTEQGSGSSWTVVYVPADLDRTDPSAVTLSATDTTITLTSLTPNTAYDVYVIVDCGTTEGGVNMISFRTACAFLDSLPFVETFESAPTGSSSTGSTFVNCWGHLNNGTSYGGYPYVGGSTYNHTLGGAKGLYWYNTTTTGTYGDYQCIVLPGVDTTVYPINTLQLTFWSRASSSSYSPVFQVGVMTDPFDINTFVPMDTVNVGNTITFTEFVIPFAGYTGYGNYIAVKAVRPTSSWYAYFDDVTLDTMPSCPPIRNLMVDGIGTTSASVSWDYLGGIILGEPAGYDVEVYDMDNLTAPVTTTAMTRSSFFTGLTPGTHYKMRVRVNCGSGYGLWDSVLFSTIGMPCVEFDTASTDTIVYSTGTTTTNGVFVYTGYGNSFCQSIYTATDLAAMGITGGRIKGVRLGYNAAGTYSKELTIFMGNTSASSLASTASMVNPGTMTQVYGPTVRTATAANTGWVYYEFNTPFLWDGSSNIIMSTFMNQSGSSQTSSGFYAYSTDAGRSGASVYKYKDSSPFTLADCLTTGIAGTSSTYLPSITFILDGCIATDSCAAPLVVIDTVGANHIDISWNAGFNETSWTVEYRAESDTDWTYLANTSSTSYSLIGLSGNTDYRLRVTSNCGDTNRGTVVTARTLCTFLDVLPFVETFESAPTGSSSTGSVFVNCWNRLNNGTSYGGYPYVGGSTYNHTLGGAKGLYWYNTTTTGTYGDYQCVVLPGVDTTVYPMNTTQLRFWARASSSSYSCTFQIGVMSDPNDITTFRGVDTVTVNTIDWTEIETPFTSYVGTGCYPAVKADRATAWYAYVDDFTLEVASTCARPNNLYSTGNTPTTITFQWNERGSATEWEVAIETSATALPTGDSVVTSNPLTLTGLTGGISYYIYVRSICGVGDTSEWSDAMVGACGTWNMRTNQTDTLYMCGGTIYDDGGPAGVYSSSQNSYVIIQPDSPNNLVSVSGTSYTESSFDYIRIYDGAGTTGTELWTDYGVSAMQSFGPLTSTSGPITVYFHTDGSVTYDGFAINVNCIYSSCRVSGVRRNTALPASDSQLDVIWDTNGALYYQVEYGNAGFAQGTGTLLTTYTNTATLTGLTGMTNYDVYVRSICPGPDTGSWVSATLQTAMCATAVERFSYDSTMGTTTSEDAPIGNSYYEYSYVQTLIDSAQMAGLTDPINAFAFNPASADYGSYYTHMDIYMANVPESDLSVGFIMPNSTTHQFVKVLDDADLCYTTTGWQTHAFDTTFTWDGHSNVLFVVNRSHGSYEEGAMFNVHTTTGVKTRYDYQDGDPYSPTTVSGGTAANYVGDLKFIACATASCRQPVITGTTYTYEDATVTWTGTGSSYEVNIKESVASDYTAADIAVTGTSYTFTGLQPATSYTFRVRQDCTADSLGYSGWATGSFTTDSLPCLPPTGLAVDDITNTTASFDWQPFGTETMWEVRVWNTGGYDSSYTANSHPVLLGGFTAGVSYSASVRPLCGTDHNIVGDWSDTVSFTAATCPDVTDLATGNVTVSSVTLTWAANPEVESWAVEYGYSGFEQGSGTTVTATTNSCVINGLIDETGYDFYVRAVCGADWYSENWAHVTATTASSSVVCDAPTGVQAVATGNEATVSWTAGEGNLSFEIEYGLRGFSHGTGTIVTAAASPTTLTGLDYETQYDVYVRALCTENVYSAWSVVATFATGTLGIDGVSGIGCAIYPNPTDGATTVSVSGVSGSVRIAVVDMNGREVAVETLDCTGDCAKTMEVDNLAQGAYFVRITGESVNMVRKLIVR